MRHAPKITISSLSFLRQALRNPIALHAKIFETYGDIAWKKARGQVSYYIGHPTFAQYVLNDHQDNFINRHPLLRSAFSPFIGFNGLITTNDLEQWYHDRLIAKMSFDGDVYFKEYSQTITSLTEEVLRGWEENHPNKQLITIDEEIDKLLITIVTNTLFVHLDLLNPDELAKVMPTSVELIKKKLHTIIKPLWFFSPYRSKYEETVLYFKNLTTSIIRNRLNENKEWDDMLGHFIHSYRHLNKEEIIETLGHHLATFLVVGYFTTVSLLHWLLVMLSLYPSVEREICKECEQVIGSRVPQYEDLAHLPYLACVIKETLRLHSSNHVIMRQSLQDDVMGDYFIPANAGIVLSIAHIHRHIDFWENPDGFEPLRFLNNPLGQENRFAYIPFGWENGTALVPLFLQWKPS